MKEIIKQLIKIDKEAQKTTELAIAKQNDAKHEIEAQSRALRSKILKEADRKCLLIEEEEKNKRDRLIAEEKEKIGRIIARLDEAYNENSDKWTEEIVRGVIGE